jgi:hypothetical protein
MRDYERHAADGEEAKLRTLGVKRDGRAVAGLLILRRTALTRGFLLGGSPIGGLISTYTNVIVSLAEVVAHFQEENWRIFSFLAEQALSCGAGVPPALREKVDGAAFRPFRAGESDLHGVPGLRPELSYFAPFGAAGGRRGGADWLRRSFEDVFFRDFAG